MRFGRLIILGVLLASTILATCQPAYAARLVIVFGLDETGSYVLCTKAIAVANTVIAGLQPGDVFYARRITGASYHHNCALFRLEVPTVGKKPSNGFDRRAWQSYRRSARRAAALKSQAMNILQRLKLIKAGKTDLWGFLAAASERFQAEGNQNVRRILIIASDMRNNVRQKVKPNLLKAEVYVVVWQAGEDPAYAHSLKLAWTRMLIKQCKAASVQFIPPDVRLLIKR